MNDSSKDNFAFVMNVSGLSEDSGFTLAPGHQLRRAKGFEISVIEKIISGRAVNRTFMPLPWQWKARVGAGGHLEYFAREEWRYFVIAFQGANDALAELELSLAIAPLELKVAFTVLPGCWRE